LTVEIKECYREKPPVNARRIVQNLLDGIPQKYLRGLRTVVLRDFTTLNYDRRRAKTWSRKKKVSVRKSGGVYHQEWKGEPAWIEIFVDNLINSHEGWFAEKVVPKIPLMRDMIFAETLYHEIGHHIHKTQAPVHKEREDVADKWQTWLTRYYFKHKYWYVLMPLAVLFWPFFKIRRVLKKKSRKRLRNAKT